METQKSSNKLLGVGLLAAVSASLCCISPVLAFLAGSSGMAATFSWMEPFRPYLIGITALVLGLAWYQKMKPRSAEEIACDCEADGKPPFLQSKAFLGMTTVFAGLMLAFPYYSEVFYPQTAQASVAVFQGNSTQKLVLDIQGMTCTGCEAHVVHAAQEVNGIQQVQASYAEGKAEIAFDPAQTTPEKIIEAVQTTGYTITSSHLSSIEQ